jgi:hypothetical protein
VDVLLEIAVRVVGFLTPLALKGAEGFTQKVGADLADKTIALLERLRTRWVGDAEATKALERFERDPQTYLKDLRRTLIDRMQADPELLEDMRSGVEGIGPKVVIAMHGNDVRVQTGPDIREIASGDVMIEQSVDLADEQVGPKIDRIG